LTEEELESIKSFNDQISLQDVIDVYLPLVHLIHIYKRTKEDLAFSKGIFLQRESKSQPFIIGVSGSVAVGKSTTSRLLQILLSRTLTDAKVELVTTDGFLYPNQTLKEKGAVGFTDDGVGVQEAKIMYEAMKEAELSRKDRELELKARELEERAQKRKSDEMIALVNKN